MARPIKKRTAKSYQRDVEVLGRLRTAIQIDGDVDFALQSKALENIDALIATLAAILQKQQ